MNKAIPIEWIEKKIADIKKRPDSDDISDCHYLTVSEVWDWLLDDWKKESEKNLKLKDCLDDGVEVTFSKIINPADCNYGKYLITMTTCNRKYKKSRFITENDFLYLHERVDGLYNALKWEIEERKNNER